MNFGEHLRSLREAARLNLRDVEKSVGMASGYLCQVENGHRNPPNPRFLRKLAALYGASFYELVDRAWPPETPEATIAMLTERVCAVEAALMAAGIPLMERIK